MQTIELIPALDNARQVLIIGAMGTGKTTLLQALMSRRQGKNDVIILDPHAYPDKWAGCHTVGAAQDYNSIEVALNALIREKNRRYGQIGRGEIAEDTHPKATILIDEWRAIVRNVGQPAKEAIRVLLTESRKASFSVFVATHSDRATPLGLDGEYDLKDGFSIVKLTMVNNERKATLDFGEGPIPAILPYMPNIIEQKPEPIVLDAQPNELEQAVLELKSEGKSISAIAREVLGSKGGHQNGKVKKILEKYDNIVPAVY